MSQLKILIFEFRSVNTSQSGSIALQRDQFFTENKLILQNKNRNVQLQNLLLES